MQLPFPNLACCCWESAHSEQQPPCRSRSIRIANFFIANDVNLCRSRTNVMITIVITRWQRIIISRRWILPRPSGATTSPYRDVVGDDVELRAPLGESNRFSAYGATNSKKRFGQKNNARVDDCRCLLIPYFPGRGCCRLCHHHRRHLFKWT